MKRCLKKFKIIHREKKKDPLANKLKLKANLISGTRIDNNKYQ